MDAQGNAYVTGWTESSDLPTTAGAYDRTFNGGWDIFVCKVNPAGSGLAYGTLLGGAFEERAQALALDPQGNAYISGFTLSPEFPTTPGAFDRVYDYGVGDAFAAKLDASGSSLVYSTFLGGSGEDKGYAIAADAAGCAHVVGMTRSTDFPTTPGCYDATANGFQDAFIVKLNPTGSAALYATYFGGSLEEQPYGLTLDDEGCVLVAGLTKSSGPADNTERL